MEAWRDQATASHSGVLKQRVKSRHQQLSANHCTALPSPSGGLEAPREEQEGHLIPAATAAPVFLRPPLLVGAHPGASACLRDGGTRGCYPQGSQQTGRGGGTRYHSRPHLLLPQPHSWPLGHRASCDYGEVAPPGRSPPPTPHPGHMLPGRGKGP